MNTNYPENTPWDEADSANWTDEDLARAFTSAWETFGLPSECRWDDVEEDD
jgi:hypothetical protein